MYVVSVCMCMMPYHPLQRASRAFHHIGEDHAGAAEDTLFKDYIVVDGYVILDFAVVANGDFVAYKDVLTERAGVTNFRT